MTLAQLEAVYKANLGVGELEALEAVYMQGYYDGAGITVTATSPSLLAGRSAPTPATTVKLSKPDLR